MPGDPNVVYRRVTPHQNNWVEEPDGRVRVSSGAFRDKNGVSVWDGAVCSPDDVRGTDAEAGVWAIPKSLITDNGARLESKPEDGPGHLEIHGGTKSLPSKIAANATEVIVGQRPAPYRSE